MKRIVRHILWAIAIVALTAGILFASYALGTKTRTSGGRNVDVFTQTCTGLTTKQDCFAAQRISGYASWVVYVKNVGSNALTDLDILINYEDDNWDDAPVNLTDAQPFGTDWNSGCTTTLAADTACVVGIDAAPPIGWIKIQAQASSATSVTVTLIGRIE